MSKGRHGTRRRQRQPRPAARSHRLFAAIALAVAATAVAILATELFHDQAAQLAIADGEAPTAASEHLCGSGQVPADGRKCGPDSAPVKVIEISDYQCPWCKRFVDTTEKAVEEQYVAKGLVQIEFRNFVLGSTLPAEAAECANEQGRYWEYHYKLFEEQAGGFDSKRLKQFASELGLDRDEFDACLDSHRHIDLIERERQEAVSLGARGTPTLVINGTMVPGYLPFDRFQPLLEDALTKAKEAE